MLHRIAGEMDLVTLACLRQTCRRLYKDLPTPSPSSLNIHTKLTIRVISKPTPPPVMANQQAEDEGEGQQGFGGTQEIDKYSITLERNECRGFLDREQERQYHANRQPIPPWQLPSYSERNCEGLEYIDRERPWCSLCNTENHSLQCVKCKRLMCPRLLGDHGGVKWYLRRMRLGRAKERFGALQ